MLDMSAVKQCVDPHHIPYFHGDIKKTGCVKVSDKYTANHKVFNKGHISFLTLEKSQETFSSQGPFSLNSFTSHHMFLTDGVCPALMEL